MANGSDVLKGFLIQISRRSAYSQIIIGVTSGWATGFITMKFGKFAAFAIGGCIVLGEIAHQEGLIKIDWSKLTQRVDSITDKVGSSIVKNDKTWLEKTEKYLDRKLDKADNILKTNNRKIEKWYTKLIGDEDGPKINDLHIFIGAFVGGIALGVATC